MRKRRPSVTLATDHPRTGKTSARSTGELEARNDRLVAFDYFRGIAILLVVAGHSLNGWAINTLPEKVLANLLLVGTSLFVFISGFFYHHVYFNKGRSYRDFLLARLKGVVVPYTALTIIGFTVYLWTGTVLPSVGSVRKFFSLGVDIGVWSNIKHFLAYFLTGRIATGYWYVPFAVLLFLISPLLAASVSGLRIRWATLTIAILLMFSSFIQRPEENLSAIHSLIYFVPVYILGIYCSARRTALLELLRGKEWILAIFVVSVALAQSLIYTSVGNLHKVGLFSYHGLGLMIFQKTAMCILLVSVLSRLEETKIPLLGKISNASFAVYFLHPWVIQALKLGGYYRLDLIKSLPGPVITLTVTMVAVGASYLVLQGCRLLIGTKSRYILGC